MLRGEATLELAVPRVKHKATKKKRGPVADLSDKDIDLFEALREIRQRLAKEQGVPPYVIFHDSTLIALAQDRPKTMQAFGRMPGVGAVKLDRYGKVFLDVICSHKA